MATRDEASIGDLLRQLVEDGNHLIRTEIRLAKAEVRNNIGSAMGGAAMIGLGSIVLLGAVFTLLGAAVGFLTPLVGAGWAALIVGVATLVVGGIMIAIGGRKLQMLSLTPDRSVASLQRDAQTITGKN